MGIPKTGPPLAHNLYPIPLQYQKFIDEEIWLLEKAGCISKSLSPWATPVAIFLKKQHPLHPEKTTMLGLRLLFINQMH